MTTGAAGISATAAGNSPSSTGTGRAWPAADGALFASDAAACASRAYELQQLAARVAACADNTDAVLARLASVELRNWHSPAGRAYRTCLSLQAASLRRSRTALQEAAAAVLRHAQSVVQSSNRSG